MHIKRYRPITKFLANIDVLRSENLFLVLSKHLRNALLQALELAQIRLTHQFLQK